MSIEIVKNVQNKGHPIAQIQSSDEENGNNIKLNVSDI